MGAVFRLEGTGDQAESCISTKALKTRLSKSPAVSCRMVVRGSLFSRKGLTTNSEVFSIFLSVVWLSPWKTCHV